MLEIGQTDTVDTALLASQFQLGHQLADHRQVIAAFELSRHHERTAADGAQGILQLGFSVRGIDVDKNEADPRGGELRDQPFMPVGCPDTDAIAPAQTQCQQARCHTIDPGCEVVPGQAQPFGIEDGRVTRTMSLYALL